MNTIIDFSSRCVVWRQRDVWGFYDPANYLCATNRIFPIEWNDKQFVSYAEFCQVLQRGIQIMATRLDSGPLLVVCDRGVNRSVSLAIAYAIKQLGWKFNDVLNYIDQVKNTMYPRVWTSLSNHQIRRRLRNFEGTYRQVQIQF